MEQTEKQASYRQDLIKQAINKAIANTTSPMSVFKAILAVNLPEPTDTRDASAQIDALKHDIRKYNAEWAQGIVSQLDEAKMKATAAELKSLNDSCSSLEMLQKYDTNRAADVKRAIWTEFVSALRIS